MDLKIDYQELNTVSTQIFSKAEEFQQLLNNIKSANNELQTYWEGTDASKYSTKVAEQAEYMQKLAGTINDIGEFLVKVQQAYQKVGEENANAIQ